MNIYTKFTPKNMHISMASPPSTIKYFNFMTMSLLKSLKLAFRIIYYVCDKNKYIKSYSTYHQKIPLRSNFAILVQIQ